MAHRRRLPEVNVWPGWVDALSSIILVVVFVLMIFVVAQFLLQNALVGRDSALERLSARIAELTDQLNIAQDEGTDLRRRLTLLGGELEEGKARESALKNELERSESEAVTLRTVLNERQALIASMQMEAENQQGLLEEEQSLHAAAMAEIAALNSNLEALNGEISRLNEALEASEAKRSAQKVEISNLSQRLNEALADKVAELARYRSEFFGRLRAAIGKRTDVRIVGDRFVFQSEVLFPSGSAELSTDGQAQMAQLARTLRKIALEIPRDVNWILRIDGHTDRLPIRTAQFPSNWELSTARALSCSV